MPNFLQYYKSLTWRNKNNINKLIMEHCDVSYPTIYQKMKNNTFTKLEKEKIAQLLNMDVNELFPPIPITELLPKF